jgi:hypothetical protein
VCVAEQTSERIGFYLHLRQGVHRMQHRFEASNPGGSMPNDALRGDADSFVGQRQM